MTAYIFSKNIKFGERQRYEYIPFQGKILLDDYFQDRSKHLVHLDKIVIPKTLDDLCFNLSSSCKHSLNQHCNVCFLCNVIIQTAIEDIAETEIAKIDTLIKKYEIKRKIYYFDRQINEFHEPMTGSDIIALPLFSITLLKMFKFTKNYQYLSTALKINDMIASNIHVTTKCEENNRLIQISFLKELEIIKEIVAHENI